MHDPVQSRSHATSRNIELAARLLDATSEAGLERFLGRLVAETARDAGGRIPTATGRALVTVFAKTAERTLPTLTNALGVGPAAETAARVYGVELEGMSAEDRDWEIARQFVRFAQAASALAARTRASHLAAVDAAVASAAQRFAPGLLIAPGP
jgi:hypothetical protein